MFAVRCTRKWLDRGALKRLAACVAPTTIRDDGVAKKCGLDQASSPLPAWMLAGPHRAVRFGGGSSRSFA